MFDLRDAANVSFRSFTIQQRGSAAVFACAGTQALTLDGMLVVSRVEPTAHAPVEIADTACSGWRIDDTVLIGPSCVRGARLQASRIARSLFAAVDRGIDLTDMLDVVLSDNRFAGVQASAEKEIEVALQRRPGRRPGAAEAARRAHPGGHRAAGLALRGGADLRAVRLAHRRQRDGRPRRRARRDRREHRDRGQPDSHVGDRREPGRWPTACASQATSSARRAATAMGSRRASGSACTPTPSTCACSTTASWTCATRSCSRPTRTVTATSCGSPRSTSASPRPSTPRSASRSSPRSRARWRASARARGCSAPRSPRSGSASAR